MGQKAMSARPSQKPAIILRHQDRTEEAQRLMSSAASRVEATGLRTDASLSAYAQMLCTLAYTAARGGQRPEALAMTEEARRAAHRLPKTTPAGRLLPISPAAVDLYAVGVGVPACYQQFPTCAHVAETGCPRSWSGPWAVRPCRWRARRWGRSIRCTGTTRCLAGREPAPAAQRRAAVGCGVTGGVRRTHAVRGQSRLLPQRDVSSLLRLGIPP
ncbi:tetratricopeptide repeat protein [Streptomyces sp. NBC_01613]|uniref:tetratricopeptide repeat protein n=1 Tax=Streptomyces sp. NBC_01613 TaxID=2975896 RepID=UPI003863BBD0